MANFVTRVFGTNKLSHIFLDLLTFERLLTKPVIHLIYWAGLMLLFLAAFSVVGGAVGIAINDNQPWGWFLAFPFLIGGMLFVLAGMLLWRSFCEFYVAIFRIADDLHALRTEASQSLVSKPAPVNVEQAPAETIKSVYERQPETSSLNKSLAESRSFPNPAPEAPSDKDGDETDHGDIVENPFGRRARNEDFK